MKICIFMSDNRPLNTNFETAEYPSLVASINYEYSKKHGYDFVYYRPYLKNKDSLSVYNCIDPNTLDKRHAAWSKLLSTELLLKQGYDYIVYIDSDCIFKNFNKTIESIISNYTDRDMIFIVNHLLENDYNPCSGFYICKVTDYTEKFITHWYNYNIPESNRDNYWEQDALWKFYKYSNIAVIADVMFSDVDGQLIRHLAAGTARENSERIPYFKKFILDNNIDFNYNILRIRVISFDTNPRC